MTTVTSYRGLLHSLKIAKHWSTMLQERNGSLQPLHWDFKPSAKQFLLDLTVVTEEVAGPPILFPYHSTATVKSDELVTPSSPLPQLTAASIPNKT